MWGFGGWGWPWEVRRGLSLLSCILMLRPYDNLGLSTVLNPMWHVGGVPLTQPGGLVWLSSGLSPVCCNCASLFYSGHPPSIYVLLVLGLVLCSAVISLIKVLPHLFVWPTLEQRVFCVCGLQGLDAKKKKKVILIIRESFLPFRPFEYHMTNSLFFD